MSDCMPKDWTLTTRLDWKPCRAWFILGNSRQSTLKEKGFAPCALTVPKPAPRLCLPLALHKRIEEDLKEAQGQPAARRQYNRLRWYRYSLNANSKFELVFMTL